MLMVASYHELHAQKGGQIATVWQYDVKMLNFTQVDGYLDAMYERIT